MLHTSRKFVICYDMWVKRLQHVDTTAMRCPLIPIHLLQYRAANVQLTTGSRLWISKEENERGSDSNRRCTAVIDSDVYAQVQIYSIPVQDERSHRYVNDMILYRTVVLLSVSYVEAVVLLCSSDT